MDDSNRLTTNIVGPSGPLTAQLCAIGEAPGKEEDEASPPEPFVGGSGRLLNRCFKTVGLLRSEVLLNNIFCQRPPKNSVDHFFKDSKRTVLTWEGQEHVAILQNWLQKLLELRTQTGVGPNCLLALGDVAMFILTGKKRITKWRGSVLPCTLVPGFKVYVTYHPSFVNRMMEERIEDLQSATKKIQVTNALPLFLKDLERAKEQSLFPELRYPRREFLITETLQKTLEEIHKLSSYDTVSVDIETLRGSDGPFLWFIGFSPKPDYAFTIPFIKRLRFHWTPLEEAQILIAISRFFLNPKIKKVFQGGSYDLSILGRYLGLRLADNTYEDTMLLHHASYPYLQKALHILTSIHTWEPYYKDDGKVWDGRRISDEAEGLYNCKDCAVQREIFSPLLQDARTLGTEGGYRRTLGIFPSILYMQIRGVKIDEERRKTYIQQLEEKTSLAEKTASFLAGTSLNLNSPVQLNRLLYSVFKMPIQYDRKTKKATTDKEALQKLLRLYPNSDSMSHKLLKALLEYRKLEKLLSTYANMEVDSDGRIHTSYSWISTWRLSSSESHFGKGGNLQNIPVRSEEGREIRRLFIPDEGKVFLSCDLVQAEAMVVAWLARDKRLIEMFLSGVDVHWERTKELFGMPSNLEYHSAELYKIPQIDTPMPMKWFRDLTKRFVHGGNYKMGYMKQWSILMMEGIEVPVAFCREANTLFKMRNPLTVQWQNRVEEKIRRDRILITPLGRKREFRGRLSDDLVRGAVAFIPQSTVGEVTQLGMLNIYERDYRFEPLLNVHDENLGQCLQADLPSCADSLALAMKIPLEIEGKELIIPRELKAGPNWGDLKTLKEVR